MQIELRDINLLIPYKRNSRTHPAGQVLKLVALIDEYGMAGTVIVAGGVIAKGHGTCAALRHIYNEERPVYPPPGKKRGAQPLPMNMVPVIDATGWDEEQFKAYVLADNQSALNAGWDTALLAGELADLQLAGFDLALTAFDPSEIAELVITEQSAATGAPELPSGDKTPFQQKTFTLHDDQAGIVDVAIAMARTRENVDTGVNENSNGNALALICKEWFDTQNGNG
jgi:hypothetical protein